MAAVVINHLSLNVAVDELAAVVDEKFGGVLRDMVGFQRFHFVKTGEREATVVLVWASEHEAAVGDAALGKSLFKDYLTPHVAGAAHRRAGKVVAEASR